MLVFKLCPLGLRDMSGDSKTEFQTLQRLSCPPTRATLFSTVLYIGGLLKILFEKLFNYFKTNE